MIATRATITRFGQEMIMGPIKIFWIGVMLAVTKQVALGGGGGTPLYKPYRCVLPQPVVVFFSAFLVWKRVRFSRELRERMNVVIVSVPN